jgi:TolB-like protein
MKSTLVITALMLSFALTLEAQKTLPDGVQDLSSQIAAGLAKQNKQRVGITAFTDLQGAHSIFGAYLAEAITTRLVIAGVDVVERPQMEKVLAALKIEASSAIDPATAKQVGHQAGVDAIVIGTATDFTSAVAINARVIDVSTGRVVAAASTLLTRDTMVSSMLGKAPGAAPPVAPEVKEKPAEVKKKKEKEEDPDTLSWMVGSTRVVVDSTERNYGSVSLALAFENDTEESRTIRVKTYHLIDENGDLYRYVWDSEHFVENGVTIPPESRARSTFNFHCTGGGCNGTRLKVLDTNNTIVLRNVVAVR